MSERSDRRREELIRAVNYFGERAALAYLDGFHDNALTAADLAVKNLRQLVKIGGPDLPNYVDVLADSLRDRAEIISVVAPARQDGKLYRQAIRDAEEGIELYRQHGGANGRPAPLWIASVQILLAELRLTSGQAEPAARAATAALVDYREHVQPDERSQLTLAHALSRYANVMAATGAAEAALEARRESVLLYRPWLGLTSDLLKYRFDRSLTWASTPTLDRASRTAVDLARQLEPPDDAPEALAALQDAAEGFASLVTTPSARLGLPDRASWAEMATVREVVVHIAGWLTAIEAHETAEVYRRTALTMTNLVTDNFFGEIAERFATVEDRVRALRPLLAPYLEPG